MRQQIFIPLRICLSIHLYQLRLVCAFDKFRKKIFSNNSIHLNPPYMLRRKIIFLLALGLMSSAMLYAQGKKTRDNKGKESDTAKSKSPTVKEKTASSKKISGLFTLYQDTITGSVQLYITKKQLGREFIYQSFSMGGPIELFLNQNMFRETWLFSLRKNFDKIVFVRQNANYYYDPANAVSKSANVDVSEAVFYSEKVVAEDSDGFLI